MKLCVWKSVCIVVMAAGLAATAGCNPGSALGLQDWGRDLLGSVIGGALGAALSAAGGQEAIQGEKGDPGDPGEPGEQGPAGADGAQAEQGAPGEPGAAGPEYFSVFIDEFYHEEYYQVELDDASYESSPNFVDMYGELPQAQGWKVAVPNRYGGADPITMRLFLTVEFPGEASYTPGTCDVFELAALWREPGSTLVGFGLYGGPPLRYLTIEVPAPPDDPDETVYLVVDVPLYGDADAGTGLGISTRAAADMLYFGMGWADSAPVDYEPGCEMYGRFWRIHGVEFFDAETAAVSGATITTTKPDCTNCVPSGE